MLKPASEPDELWAATLRMFVALYAAGYCGEESISSPEFPAAATKRWLSAFEAMSDESAVLKPPPPQELFDIGAPLSMAYSSAARAAEV